MENKVNVVVGSEIITLKSVEQPEYLQRLGRYVDEKISDIKSKSIGATLDEHIRSILVAFNIADDYHKALDAHNRLETVHKRFVMETGRLQDENNAMKEKTALLEHELVNVKKELKALKKELAEALKQASEEFPREDNVIQMPLQPKHRKGQRVNEHLG